MALDSVTSGEEFRFTIRNAGHDDAGPMLTILDEAWAKHYPSEDLGITEESIRAHQRAIHPTPRLQQMHDLIEHRRRDGEVLVAVSGGKPIGFVMGRRGDLRNEITAWYVHPNFEKRGAGRGLLGKILELLGDEKDIDASVVSHSEEAKKSTNNSAFVR